MKPIPNDLWALVVDHVAEPEGRGHDRRMGRWRRPAWLRPRRWKARR